eukprot:jgi/Bigna1/69286/fgenesh1_pg.8_\
MTMRKSGGSGWTMNQSIRSLPRTRATSVANPSRKASKKSQLCVRLPPTSSLSSRRTSSLKQQLPPQKPAAAAAAAVRKHQNHRQKHYHQLHTDSASTIMRRLETPPVSHSFPNLAGYHVGLKLEEKLKKGVASTTTRLRESKTTKKVFFPKKRMGTSTSKLKSERKKLPLGRHVRIKRKDYTTEMTCEVDYPCEVDDYIDAILYEPPPELGPPKGIVVCAPGSLGGLGPGIIKGTEKGIDKDHTKGVYGAIYIRLGLELANCCECSWNWETKRERKSRMDLRRHNERLSVAVLQIDWISSSSSLRSSHHYLTVRSFRVSGHIRLKSTLVHGVNDVRAAVNYMCSRYNLPGWVLIGNSLGGERAIFFFKSGNGGGPSVWAATTHLPKKRVLAVVSFAGSARGGPIFEKQNLGTVSAASNCGTSMVFKHAALPEELILIDAPALIYEIKLECYSSIAVSSLFVDCPLNDNEQNSAAGKTSTLVVVMNGEHIFAFKRHLVYPLAKRFILHTLFGSRVAKPLAHNINLVSATREGGTRSLSVEPADLEVVKKNRFCSFRTRQWWRGGGGEPRPRMIKKRSSSAARRKRRSKQRTKGVGIGPKSIASAGDSTLAGYIGYNE